MDILLTHGYFIDEDLHEQKVMKPYPPLGLLYISSHLKAKGVAVNVFDTTFQSWKALADYLEQNTPPVVGIYGNMMTRPNVLKIIRKCKTLGAWVILGGPEPSNYSEEYFKEGADAICFGEGEETLEELLQNKMFLKKGKLAGIRGLIYQDQAGRVVRNEARPYIKDLNKQPFPDRGAIDQKKYIEVWRKHHDMGPVSLITARGCAYSCSWCSHSVFGHTNRRRSPENVVEEIELIIQDYRPDMLWYADDVFTLHHRWLRKFNELMKTRRLHFPFETISREDRLNEETIKILAELGCWRIWIGAESGSQRILDKMQRGTNADRVCELIPLLQKHGIKVGLFIMLGYDGEETEDLKATAEFLKRANPDVFFTTVVYPIKGTTFYNEVQDRVFPLDSWHTGSDRDYRLDGNHTPRYFKFANRWLLNEVSWHRQRTDKEKDFFKMVKTITNINIGRLGMRMTFNEKTSYSQSS